MAYRSTAEFVAALEAAGELVRVPFPVATELEITAWAMGISAEPITLPW